MQYSLDKDEQILSNSQVIGDDWQFSDNQDSSDMIEKTNWTMVEPERNYNENVGSNRMDKFATAFKPTPSQFGSQMSPAPI